MAVVVLMVCLVPSITGQSLDLLGAGTEEALQSLVKHLQPNVIPRFVGCILDEPQYTDCDKRSRGLKLLFLAFDTRGFVCDNCSKETVYQMCLVQQSLLTNLEQCNKLRTGLILETDICVPNPECANVPIAAELSHLLEGIA
ncbi:hypothetical protein Hamer_G023956 [Homarus americanus]|uniref:Uncharacterized protein n=2 Tax=Homarus americanus TaxID=6706 RepID=A0A8J5J861_HOMAM|nr:hypothetical protein Hamer_G023956 [Homarus americanus]